jgi:FixJ family two-component response regulator
MPNMGLHQKPTAGPQRTSTPRPVVFVVEDDVSVRESLEALLAFEGWTVAGFDSAQAFLSHPRAGAPSCLVLDVGLPDLDGLELQQRIGADQQALPIIFITGQADVPMTVRAMKAGAIEFLTKPLDSDALLSAVQQAVERSRGAIAADASLNALRAAYATLSPREREVMALIVAGRLNKQVGGELGISEITVKAHRGQLMRKMQAKSFADLVNMAGRLGVPG